MAIQPEKIETNYYPTSQTSGTSGTPTTGSTTQGMSPDTTPATNTPNNPIPEGNIATVAGGSILKSGYFQSINYVKGVSGFIINSDGSVEFGSGYFRGDITGASGTFSGTITATAGSIGGFNIGSDYIRDVANSFGLASTVTGGNDVRFWAGDTYANRSTAPLRLYEDGAIVATNITATGSIFATSGWIGSATALVYESQGINTGTTGWIRGGQTGWNTGDGFYLGYYLAGYGLSIGNSATGNYLKYDTTSGNLVVNDSILSNQAIYGDGSDGDVTISSNTTLTADVYYNNLTIQDTFVLNPNGFKIRVKGTYTAQGTGKIASNGGAGGNATAGSGITAGTAGAAGTQANTVGTLPASLPGVAGSNGTNGVNTNGSSPAAGGNGSNGTGQTKSLGSAGKNGANGGKGGEISTATGNGGTGGTGGALSGTVFNKPRNITAADNLFDIYPSFTVLSNSASSASSGAGSGGTVYTGTGTATSGGGGGGAGSGATGGFVWLAAKKIVSTNGNSFLEAKGGAGGNGGNGGNAATTGNGKAGGGGGGGAGSGGNGGCMVLIYSTITGTGTYSVAGGAAGAIGIGGTSIGAGVSPAVDGGAGTAGATGFSYIAQV